MALLKRTPSPPDAHPARRHERDLAGLARGLHDPDAAARRWAARDLQDHGAAASPLLVEQLKRETEPAVREAILMSLTGIGDAAAVSGLVDCLRLEDAQLRNEAIEAMKRLPDAVAPIMSGLLADPDPDVRIFAVNVLESLRLPEVEAWLIDVIRDDEHVNVCATAVDLLGEVGTEAAVPALDGLTARFPDQPYIAFAARLALKRIRGA